MLQRDKLNWEQTGGQIGWKRRLPTMTIHYNEDTGRYFVTDDKTGFTRSGGHKTVEDAIRINKPYADARTRMY